MDGRNPAPPKKPWSDDSPVNTKRHRCPFGRKIEGPGFPGGSINYAGHLFSQKDIYASICLKIIPPDFKVAQDFVHPQVGELLNFRMQSPESRFLFFTCLDI